MTSHTCDFCGRLAEVRPYAVESSSCVRGGNWCARCRTAWVVLEGRREGRRADGHVLVFDDWDHDSPADDELER